MVTEDIKYWKLLDGYESPSNLRGFISYDRLAEVLNKTGELKSSESISDVRVTDMGISFGVVDWKD